MISFIKKIVLNKKMKKKNLDLIGHSGIKH